MEERRARPRVILRTRFRSGRKLSITWVLALSAAAPCARRRVSGVSACGLPSRPAEANHNPHHDDDEAYDENGFDTHDSR
jgi:hypothetical protein